MDKDGLLTVGEFTRQIQEWTVNVYIKSREVIFGKMTKGKGVLYNSHKFFVNWLKSKQENEDPPSNIKFKFATHGVFRAYGAGRGYVVVNGVIKRGYRVIKKKDVALGWRHYQNTAMAREFRRQGFKNGQIRDMKIVDENNQDDIRRSPLDWLDKYIAGGMNNLADTCVNYYGDDALRGIAEQIGRAKIKK